MLATLSLLIVFVCAPNEAAPAKPVRLTVSNVRMTYGVQGPRRPGNKFLPGDEVDLSFDIEGVRADANGKAKYSVALEVRDMNGVVVFTQPPQENDTSDAGKKLPTCTVLQIGLDNSPGEYTFKVTIRDLTAGVTQELMRQYQVLPRAFGLIRAKLTRDSDGTFATAALEKGESAWINCAAVGFARDRVKKQPRLTVTMQILDDRPALAKPKSPVIKDDIPKQARTVPIQFELALAKPGTYTAEIKVVDEIARRKTMLSLPITVR